MERFLVRFIMFLGLVILLPSCKTQLLETKSVLTDPQTVSQNDLLTSPFADHDIKLKAKSFSIDDLGYLYLVSNQNELIRYDPNLVKQYAYSNERLGSITSIDANNPLKLLLFYDNYQTIVLLDNLLGEIGRYELFDLGFNDINAVGISNDNNVWLYDPIAYKLKKIDNAGNLLIESITMYNEGLEYIRPTSLEEKGNKVFLYDKDHGFFLFDNLGQYLYRIPLKGLGSYQIINEETIVFLEDDLIQTYDLTYKTTQVFNPISEYSKRDVEDVLISNKAIFLKDAEGVTKRAI